MCLKLWHFRNVEIPIPPVEAYGTVPGRPWSQTSNGPARPIIWWRCESLNLIELEHVWIFNWILQNMFRSWWLPPKLKNNKKTHCLQKNMGKLQIVQWHFVWQNVISGIKSVRLFSPGLGVKVPTLHVFTFILETRQTETPQSFVPLRAQMIQKCMEN